ncbi:hypothetical protein R3P38DRAFT_2518598, partial [Favolaschia claudopus]
PVMLCVIDGDENIFSGFAAGHKGGLSAAHSLTEQICNYLRPEGFQDCKEIWFWIIVFFNRRTLLKRLTANGICSTEQFDQFIAGFSQESLRFLFVDVGDSNETGSRMRGLPLSFLRLASSKLHMHRLC